MEWTVVNRQEDPSPRSSHVAGILQDRNKNLEYIILFGGIAGSLSDDNWALNCTSRTWRPLKLNIAPTVSSAYVSTDHSIYIFGGIKKDSDYTVTNRLLEYNHLNESITVIDPVDSKFIPPPLISAAMAHYKGFLYIYGGIDARSNVSNRLYKFDLMNGIWSISNAKNPPLGRFGHSLNIWVKKYGEKNEGYLVVYGGCLGKEKNMYNSGEVLLYSIDLDQWIYPQLQGFPENYSGRVKHSAFLFGSRLVIFGGVKSGLMAGSREWEATNDVVYIKFGKEFCKWVKQERANVVPRGGQSLSMRMRSHQALIFGGYTNADGYQPNLNDIVVLDFSVPSQVILRLEKGFIRWDDQFNLHGLNSYELIITDHYNREKKVVYRGRDNFWLRSGLKPSFQYSASIVISNSLGSSAPSAELEFVHHEFILPPQNLKAEFAGTNVILEWESTQAEKSYTILYRVCGTIFGSRYARQAASSTPWMETSAGIDCKIERPVTFFIGDASSFEIAKEIEFQVFAKGESSRSEPSGSFSLSLQDYWKNLSSSNSSAAQMVSEELMVEGNSDPVDASMMIVDDDFEELAEGETVRPNSEVKEKPKAPPLERKPCKIKIKRDSGLEHKDNGLQKANLLKKNEAAETIHAQISQKRKLDMEISDPMPLISANMEEKVLELHAKMDLHEKKTKSSDESLPKKKISPKGESLPKKIEVSNGKSHNETSSKTAIEKDDKFTSSEIEATITSKTDDSEEAADGDENRALKDTEDLSNCLKSPGIEASDTKETTSKDLEISGSKGATIKTKISSESKTKMVSIEKSNYLPSSMLESSKSDNSTITKHLDESQSKEKIVNPRSNSLKSPIKEASNDDYTPTTLRNHIDSPVSSKSPEILLQSYPVSQRLQLKIIEQQKEDAKTGHEPMKRLKKHSQAESDKATDPTPENNHQRTSLEELRQVIMDESKPMYYNLRYGSDIQVLYDHDWWIAKVLFYAYDKKLNLHLKVHFPGWKAKDDVYIPLRDGDRVIRDTSIPVRLKYPTYTPTQFRFDLNASRESHHHGVKSDEVEEVVKNGYILKEMEANPRFLDD